MTLTTICVDTATIGPWLSILAVGALLVFAVIRHYRQHSRDVDELDANVRRLRQRLPEAIQRRDHAPPGMALWTYSPPPRDIGYIEVWERGDSAPTRIHRAAITPETNIYGLWWRKA